jgi:hypothetical protein
MLLKSAADANPFKWLLLNLSLSVGKRVIYSQICAAQDCLWCGTSFAYTKITRSRQRLQETSAIYFVGAIDLMGDV